MRKPTLTSSLVDSYYSSGDFFDKSDGHKDAQFKINILGELIGRNRDIFLDVRSVADVGCGSGATTLLLGETFSKLSSFLFQVDGFDIHPDIKKFEGNSLVNFIYGDFCEINNHYDFIFLFDVIEHLADTINFIKNVSSSGKFVVFHIPLDDSLMIGFRNLFLNKLKNPGHLVILDTVSALNLLAFSGLKVIDYIHSPVFKAPSGKATLSQRFFNPLRWFLFKVSPFLCQKTLGGVSLMVLAKNLSYEK